jgi:alanine racemase
MGTIGKILNKIASPRVDYQPLIEVRIFKSALLHNLRTFQQKYPKLQFVPVIKSNAYGHGMVEVAGILDHENKTLTPLHQSSDSGAGQANPSPKGRGESLIPFFMVDSFYEALVLRRAGIKTKILVLGYCREEQLLSAKLKEVSFGIIDLQILKNLSAKLKKPLNIHLKIDTGMHRQGILMSEASDAIAAIKKNKNIVLEGICSHFADADGQDSSFTDKQIQDWNKIVKVFKEAFPSIKYFHTSATAGARYAGKIDANVGRLGIGLYGIDTSPSAQLDLRPALEVVSLISSIKHIPAGEKVGYGITFTSARPMIVATVPVGYNEGVDRRLSSLGCFKIRDVFCPIVGRVSMNISSIDVTDVPDVKIEEPVVVISGSKNDKNSVENLAKLCGCIPYEILVHVPQHLRRIII